MNPQHPEPQSGALPLSYTHHNALARLRLAELRRRFARFLENKGVLAGGEHDTLVSDLYAEIDRVIHEEESAPPMPSRSLVEDVYEEVPRHLRVQYNEFIRVAERLGDAQPGEGAFPL